LLASPLAETRGGAIYTACDLLLADLRVDGILRAVLGPTCFGDTVCLAVPDRPFHCGNRTYTRRPPLAANSRRSRILALGTVETLIRRHQKRGGPDASECRYSGPRLDRPTPHRRTWLHSAAPIPNILSLVLEPSCPRPSIRIPPSQGRKLGNHPAASLSL
jgi:hypothetical protein